MGIGGGVFFEVVDAAVDGGVVGSAAVVLGHFIGVGVAAFEIAAVDSEGGIFIADDWRRDCFRAAIGILEAGGGAQVSDLGAGEDLEEAVIKAPIAAAARSRSHFIQSGAAVNGQVVGVLEDRPFLWGIDDVGYAIAKAAEQPVALVFIGISAIDIVPRHGALVILHKQEDRLHDLVDIALAGDRARLLACLGQGWHEDANQQGDNSNHHQQLDERKSAAALLRLGHHILGSGPEDVIRQLN